MNQRQEMPTGFMVATVQAHRYDITFTSQTIEAEVMLPELQKIRDNWRSSSLTHIDAFKEVAADDSDANLASLITQTLQQRFMETPVYKSTVAELERLSFWEAGSYELRLTVSLADSDKKVSHVQRIEISQDDALSFRRNAELMGLYTVGVALPRQWFFVNSRALVE